MLGSLASLQQPQAETASTSAPNTSGYIGPQMRFRDLWMTCSVRLPSILGDLAWLLGDAGDAGDASDTGGASREDPGSDLDLHQLKTAVLQEHVTSFLVDVLNIRARSPTITLLALVSQHRNAKCKFYSLGIHTCELCRSSSFGRYACHSAFPHLKQNFS